MARGLVVTPKLLLVDEPTGDLDSENAVEITELMRRLNRERGLSFVIVTHDISVGRQADRIVRMLDGRVVDQGSVFAATPMHAPSGEGSS
jgi:putative ABC transport system ATP-binding protein